MESARTTLGSHSGSFGGSRPHHRLWLARSVLSQQRRPCYDPLVYEIWVSIAFDLMHNAKPLQNLPLDQFDPEDWLVEDAFETQSEQPSTRDYDVEDTCDTIPTSRRLCS